LQPAGPGRKTTGKGTFEELSYLTAFHLVNYQHQKLVHATQWAEG
jgi:hypothetical protein